MSRDREHSHLGDTLSSQDNTCRANLCTKFDDSVFSHSREIL